MPPPERDVNEKRLIAEGIERKVPILGVCRGMQMLNVYFGGNLTRLEGHVATKHQLRVSSLFAGYEDCDVNSYHGWGIRLADLADRLRGIAFDSDGNVEAFDCPEDRILDYVASRKGKSV